MRNYPDPQQFDTWQAWAEETRAVLVAIEQEAAFQQTEIGKIGEFTLATVPEKWLLANGTAFDADSFPVLARILGGTILPNLSPQYDPGNIVAIRAA